MKKAFTLIELLVVMAIISIVVAMVVPNLKQQIPSSTIVAFQLKQDIDHARQRAMTTRRDVYLMFTNGNNYTMVSHGRIGDQPGNHSWQTISDMRSLNKHWMMLISNAPFTIPSWSSNVTIQNLNFLRIIEYTNNIPISTNDSPSLGFNWRGQTINKQNEYIPIVQVDSNTNILQKSLSTGYSIIVVDGNTGITRIDEQSVTY